MHGLTREACDEDLKAQRAIERVIQIIGDAVNKLSAELLANNPDIEWRKIYAARNIVVHHYWGVDHDVLWDVVETKLGELDAKVSDLLTQANPEATG